MKISPAHTVWYSGLLMSLSAFSIDITLPLFGVMAADLGAPIEQIPLSVMFYIISTGFGLFVFGSLSDRFGRRGLLAIGMCIFIAGALLASTADSLNTLVIARAIQGFGAASPYILSRAIIRDLYQGTELAQKMAIATGIFSLGPMLAPLLGALVLELNGQWHWIFVIMALFCTGLLMTLIAVEETNTQLNPNATKLSTLLDNTRTVISNQQSRYFILINATITVSMLLIISTSPSVYTNTFNISGSVFALYYSVHAVGIVIGQIANHRLIGRIGIVPTSKLASVVMIASALSISVCSWTDNLAPWGVSLSITIFALGFLSVVANATSMLLQSHGEIVGFTAALQGTVSMLFSGVLGSILSMFIQNNIAAWGLAIASGPVIVLMLLFRWQKLQLR